jgi:hypothetical protein
MSLVAKTLRDFLKENGYEFRHGWGENTLFKGNKQITITEDGMVSMFYQYKENMHTLVGKYTYTEVFTDIDKGGVIYYFITK